jgi:hypothetical protein
MIFGSVGAVLEPLIETGALALMPKPESIMFFSNMQQSTRRLEQLGNPTLITVQVTVTVDGAIRTQL